MKRIFLTGASGFIGSHIAEYFCKQGVDCSCLVRDARRADFLRTLPVYLVEGDILRPEILTDSLACIDTLVHTAARVSDWGRYDDFYSVNVTGTMNVMRSALHAGVRHVILTGSNASYGEESSPVVKTEDSPYNPHYPYFLDRIFPSGLNHYRDTKALACTEAMEFAARYKMDLTIIEPVWVYGEREMHTGFYEYLKTVKAGTPFFPGSDENRFHTIYVRDLARLFYLAFEARLEGVHRFLACDDDAALQRELFDMFCREAGLALPHSLPKAAVYPLALLMEAAAVLLRRPHSPMLTRAIVNIFYDNIEYSSDKATRVLGFIPEFSRAESIRRTVAWYKEKKLI
ncbi:MAG: NAD-dependent epimerase [Ignavibacteria bacterium]|nr:MAG: NAD-dependent epimerase [Ignavibacteria bacterium]